MDREKIIKDLEFCVNGHFKVELSLATKILALLKEQEPIRCKDCAYALYKEGVQPGHIVCTKPFTERWQVVKPENWFCADRVVKNNCSEFPNSSDDKEGR